MTRVGYLGAVTFGLLIALTVGVQAGDSSGSTPGATSLPLDEIILKNGSKILGAVSSARDGTVVIETDFAGAISIDATAVVSINTQGSMVVLMADGRTIRDKPIFVDKTGIRVTTDSGKHYSYDAADFDILNPEPWELGEGYKFSGLANVASTLERGNTDTDELDFKLESGWRSLEDRYTLKLHGEIDEASGVQNANNTTLVGKYDQFLPREDYWGVKFAAKQDEFADLDLRAYIGPYFGRQFYERQIFTLSGEIGLSYVTEDFIEAEDQQYAGAHWDISLESDYLGRNSRLYIEQGGLWNLEDTGDIILALTLGLSIPLLGNLEAAAEIVYEYDSGAVAGIEKLDETYKFRVGYTW